jgi:hypothetical protein
MTGPQADALSASYARGVRDERAQHQAGEHWVLSREVFRGLEVLQRFMARARGREAQSFAITLRGLLDQAVHIPESKQRAQL